MADYFDELLNPASAVPVAPVETPDLQDPVKQEPVQDPERQRLIQNARQWNALWQQRDDAISRNLAANTDQAYAFRAAMRHAEALGVSPEMAMEDPRVMERYTKERELRKIQWQADHPQLAAMLEDPRFAKVAADDINLLIQDDSWWTRVSNSFTSAYESLEAADIGRRRAFSTITPEDEIRLKDINRHQSYLQQTDGPLQWIAEQAGRMSYQLPSGLAASAAGAAMAGPVGAVVGYALNTFGWTGYEEFGQKFNELKDAGAEDNEALWGSLMHASIAATLSAAGEALTFKAAKPLLDTLVTRGVKKALADQTTKSALAAFGKTLGKEVGYELGEELGQLVSGEIGTSVAEALSDGKNYKSWENMADKITKTVIQTAVVATTFGLVPAGIQAVHAKTQIRQAQKSKEFLDELAETDGKSKLQKEAPSVQEAYLAKQAQRAGVKTLYISKQELRMALEEQAGADKVGEKATPQEKEEIVAKLIDELETKVPGVKQQYDEAVSGEDDIEIDLAKMRAAGVSTTDLYKTLTKHVRFDQNLPSAHAAVGMREVIDNWTGLLRMSAENMDETGVPQADESVAQIREKFLAALKQVPDAQFPVQAGGTADEQRRHLASVAANAFKKLAVRNLEAMPAQPLTEEQKAAGVKQPTPVQRLAAILREAGFGEGALNAEFAPEFRVTEELGSYVGESADLDTVDKISLARAKQMALDAEKEAAKLGRRLLQSDYMLIWRETGWFQGPDGKWRLDVEDRRVELSPEVKAKLDAAADGDVVETTVSEAFPDSVAARSYKSIGSIKVRLVNSDKLLGDTLGVADKFGITIAAKQTPETLANVVSHELQHAIQSEEGFARGGSAKWFEMLDEMLDVAKADQNVVQALLGLDLSAYVQVQAAKQRAFDTLITRGADINAAADISGDLILRPGKTTYEGLLDYYTALRDTAAPDRRAFAQKRLDTAVLHADYIRQELDFINPWGDEYVSQKAAALKADPNGSVISNVAALSGNRLHAFAQKLSEWVMTLERIDDKRRVLRQNNRDSGVPNSSIAQSLYMSLAGEVEAFDAGERAALQAAIGDTPASRRVYITPYVTVAMVDGKAQSRKAPELLRTPWDSMIDMGDKTPPSVRGIQDSKVRKLSKRFAQWFKGSRVVDDNGDPLVVYHGTMSEFDTFREDEYGQFYFAKDARVAASYTADPQTGTQKLGGRIVPVYLSMKNPYVINQPQTNWAQIKLPKDLAAHLLPDEAGFTEYTTRTVADLAKRAGYDGVIFRQIKDMGAPLEGDYAPIASDVFVVFQDTQIKSATGNVGTYDQNNPNIRQSSEGQSARAAYDINRLTVILTNKTAAKDVIHEIGHFWMRAMVTLVNANQASPAVRKDVDQIMSFLGVGSLENWNALSEKDREKFDEKWAYSVEQHFAEGKAPEPALEGIFARLGRYMRALFANIRDIVNPIYKSRFGEDLPMLTPEIRRVMDAMLVSEEQVTTAKAQRMISPLFMSRETYPGSDEEWESLQEMERQCEDAAVMQYFLEQMQNSKAAAELRDKIERQVEAKYKRERSAISKQEAAELAKQPVWRAVMFLTKGVIVNEQTGEEIQFSEKPVKLSRKDVEELYKRRGMAAPEEVLSKFTRKNKGEDPQTVAEMLGFGTADEMLSAIENRGDFDEQVNARVQARMQAEMPGIATAVTRENTVNMAIHNELREMFVAQELSDLLSSLQIAADEMSEDVSAEKQAARETVKRLQGERTKLSDELFALRKKKDEVESDEKLRRKAELRDQIAAIDKELRPAQKVLSGPVTSPKQLLQAARYAAAQALTLSKVGDVAPSKGGKRTLLSTRHSRAAGKASMSASTKMRKGGDRLEILRHKNDQLLHEASAKEAVKVEREIAAGRKRMDALSKVKRQDLKNHEWDYIYLARLLLSKFKQYPDAAVETGINEELTKDALLRVLNEDPALSDRLAALMAQEQRDLDSLTVAEFRDLQEVLKALRDQSSAFKRQSSLLKKKTLEETQAAVLAGFQKVAPKARIGGRDTNGETRGKNIRSALWQLRRFEHWLVGIEGQDGFLQKTLIRPMVDATYRARIRSKELRDKLVKLMQAIEPRKGPITSKILNYEFGRDGNSGQLELLMVLQQTGNYSNYSRMLKGMGWNDTDKNGNDMFDDQGRLMDTKFRAAIAELVQQGWLEKKHFQYLQGVWDLMNEAFKDAQRAHLQVTGTTMSFNKPEEMTWTLADGEKITLKGGYVPIKYNDIGPTVAGDDETVSNGIAAQASNLVPTVQNGFTKDRVQQFTGQLKFDEMSLYQHLDQVVRYAYVQPVLADITRVMGLTSRQQSPVKDLLKSIPGNPLKNMIVPWLNDVATATTQQPTQAFGGFTKAANALRRNSALNSLFGSIPNTLQQVTGLLVAASQIKQKGLLFTVMLNRDSVNPEYRNTPFMQQRLDSQMNDWQESLSRLRADKTLLKRAQDWTAQNVYWMQTKMQNFVDVLAWDAAFLDFHNGVRPQGVSEEAWTKQAQDHADSVVRRTQGSFGAEDLSTSERGNAWMKLASQFTSYFNMLVNVNGAEMERLLRDSGWKGLFKPELWVQYAWGWFLPVILSDVIARFFYADWPDDEPEERMKMGLDLFFMSQVRSIAASVPLVGQIAPAMLGTFTSSPLDDRMRLPPAIDLIINRAKDTPKSVVDLAMGEGDKYDLTNTFTWLTIFTGLPVQALVGRPSNMIYQSLANPDVTLFSPGASGGEKLLEVLDAARFLTTGMASPAQDRTK